MPSADVPSVWPLDGESAKTRTKLRVLLVEDNPADVELELLTLRKDGFEVAGDVTQTMNQGRTVFSQLISFLPDREFRRCVERYPGDSRLRGFSCWDQYLSMAFAQLTDRERSSRHRGLSAFGRWQAVPSEIPRQGGAFDAGRRERVA